GFFPNLTLTHPPSLYLLSLSLAVNHLPQSNDDFTTVIGVPGDDFFVDGFLDFSEDGGFEENEDDNTHFKDGFLVPYAASTFVVGYRRWTVVMDGDGFLLPDAASTFVVGYQRWMVAMRKRAVNKRGVMIKLQSIIMPFFEFDHEEKGDALYATELALSLEKLTNEKLLNLHEVVNENNDVHLAYFVESGFLGEQVEAIKKISEYIAQVRRVGKGHGYDAKIHQIKQVEFMLCFQQSRKNCSTSIYGIPVTSDLLPAARARSAPPVQPT
ncbi:hypothetical protein M8C21_015885, partial [Ambrosia artemisiifolia]